jgi:hypothetical protein
MNCDLINSKNSTVIKLGRFLANVFTSAVSNSHYCSKLGIVVFHLGRSCTGFALDCTVAVFYIV